MGAQDKRRFSDFLKAENILCYPAALSWKEAIGQLVELLHKNENNFDEERVLAACLQREAASSTVIAPRLALPHARVDNLKRLLVAIGIAPKGVTFPVEERGLVHVVIVILTPKDDPGLYLQALAALTRELGAEGALDRLAGAEAPEEVFDFFSERPVALPPYLKASNLMDVRPVTLLEQDNLKKTIDIFCTRHVLDIPVVDDDGDVRGTISIEDLLRLSLPEHLLWMHDLSPILRFEPFADLLRRDQESKVADFMKDDYVSVGPDVPAIQLAKTFLTQDVRQILVVEGRKLLGAVDVGAFIAKLFWA